MSSNIREDHTHGSMTQKLLGVFPGYQSLPYEVTSKLGFTSVIQEYASNISYRASTDGTFTTGNRGYGECAVTEARALAVRLAV
jgi:hypothetical protein